MHISPITSSHPPVPEPPQRPAPVEPREFNPVVDLIERTFSSPPAPPAPDGEGGIDLLL